MVVMDERVVWARLETQIAQPPALLEIEGYHPFEQPYNEHHNWIWNVRDKSANALIRERNMAHPFSPNISIEQQMAGRFGESNVSWTQAYETDSLTNMNQIVFTSDQPICLCPAWDYLHNQPCVYVGRENYDFGLYQYRQVSEQSNPIGDKSATDIALVPLDFNEATEYPEAVVSEGDYFYVMTKGHSSGNVYFYKFSANPASPTPLWSTSDDGTKFLSVGRNAMCIAGDWLAYVRTGVTIGGGAGHELVRLIRKSDAGAFRAGNGNVSGAFSSNYKPGWSIVSNGDNVFFEIYDLVGGTGWVHLCGADIADPTQATGPTGAWIPVRLEGTASNNIGPGDLVYDGRLVHFSSNNGYIGCYDWRTNTFEPSYYAHWFFTNSRNPPDRLKNAPMCYDGHGAWMLLEYDGDTNTNNAFVAFAPVTNVSLDHGVVNLPYELKPPWTKEIFLGSPLPLNPVSRMAKMVYSDNALWALPVIEDSAPGDTYLVRIPNVRDRR